LQNHGRKRDRRRVRVSYHQLPNFRVRFNDRPCAVRVRLIKFRLVKSGVHQLFLERPAYHKPSLEPSFFNNAPSRDRDPNDWWKKHGLQPWKFTMIMDEKNARKLFRWQSNRCT